MNEQHPTDSGSTPDRSGTQLGGDSLLLAIGRIAGLVSTMVLFILLSRTLSPDSYGTFRQVWMINKGLVEVFALGLPLSILYYLARLRDSEKKLFIAQSVLLLCAAAAATALAIFLLSDWIAASFGNPGLASLLRLFACYPILIAPTLAVESVLVAGGRVWQFAVFSLISRFAVLVAGGATILLGGSLTTLFSLILVAGVLEISGALVLLHLAARAVEARGRSGQLDSRPSVREQLALALPTGLSNMVGMINQELDKFIIAGSFSASQFARYANGAMEIPMLGTILASVSAVLMPEFTRRYNDGDRTSVLDLWHESICNFAALQIPLLVFFAVHATDVIVLLFSDTYRESAVIFQIYLIATIPKLTWYGTLLVAVGRTRAPLYGSLVALAVNVVLNILLIRWIGFVGPAIATTVASFGVTAFYMSRIRSALEVSWAAVFPWGRLARITMVSAVVAAIFLLLAYLPELPVALELAVAAASYAACVIVAFELLGIASLNDLRRALRTLLPNSGEEGT